MLGFSSFSSHVFKHTSDNNAEILLATGSGKFLSNQHGSDTICWETEGVNSMVSLNTLREVMSVSVRELYEDEEARESDRDSAIGSAAGSELSDGGRGGDKEEGVRMFLPQQKSGELSLNPSVTSDLSTRSLNEEQFEDYGEGDDVDYSPISPEDETHTNGFSDLGSSVPSSATHTPQKVRQVNGDHEVFCSNCCKKVTQLNELETRLKNLKTHSPNRKISSTAFGRHLLHHSNLSSRNGSTEDLFRDGNIDYTDTDIADKVSQLEKKLCELENECLMNGDVKSKLKQENTQLVHRVHELEEQLKEQEARAEQIMDDELRRHRDAFNKLERDKNAQIEILNNRVQQLEAENTEMLVSVSRLKTQTEKLDEEKQRMTDKLEDTSLRLKDEMDLYRKMMDKLRQNRNDYQREREAMQELIEELRRELEHLQLYKLEVERVGRIRRSSISLSDFSTRTRENELEQEMKRLKQENQRLREQNEELNGQILSLSLHEAKNLIATQTKAQSLAAEIDNASRDQLMEALKEQEEINIRLRQYMDKIILSILDHNPSILEIKY
ncbi:rab11 family-interacting protein 4B isoform X3 [Pangasianodon hypophthalmus]|uniref:rab11 family-interacting protein 4B isoform X3 n=1 Tax=Pangasianodon hypophthalmus TaxID=310915 RepID=UPI002306E9C9|nr:rab11 family-interacting protein 4B isoform X3 [Pangasianodon hypophthalmus]